MAIQRTPTKLILVAVALSGVVVVCLAILVVSLLARADSEPADATTSTTSSSTAPSTSAPVAPGPGEPANIAVDDVSVQVGGVPRSYQLIAPRGARAGDELPVVFVLHGLSVNAKAMSRVADWRSAVVEDRFVAVFPQGIADSWNMGPCCPPASLLGAADTAFLDTVVEEVSRRPEVDADRRYLTGFSNGAMMVYSYACERPGTFQAIAPIAGSNITLCEPSEPLSLLHQHSDPDFVVPYDGGLGVGSLISAAPFPEVPSTVAQWAAADGCAGQPERRGTATVKRVEWDDCADGTRVELITLVGLGHIWPDTGTYAALDELLRFFDLN